MSYYDRLKKKTVVAHNHTMNNSGKFDGLSKECNRVAGSFYRGHCSQEDFAV